MTAITRHFARFACNLPTPPAAVWAEADRAMFDTLGAIVVGGAHKSVQNLAAAAPKHAGQSVLATGGRADTETAALINGMAAHVWDIDDTSYTGIMHGSAVIMPAVLALGQELGCDQSKLRRAFIVGSEITYVLADICTHDHYFHGWWSTTTFGLTGTTAAAGVLLGLSEDQMVNAIGLAAAASGGSKAVFGSDGKPFLVGDTARRAISFARAAKAGLTGPEQAFEDNRGYLKLLNGGKADIEALKSLGSRWRLIDPGLLFKTNPVCSAAHAAIDQMAALMAELDAAATEVADIHAEVPELVYISLVYPDPRTPQQAQFSLPYAIACTALHGRVQFEDLFPQAVRTPEKLALISKTRTTNAADLSTEAMRAKYPESARLTVTLTNGRSASGFCGIAHGMPENPLSNTALAAKFASACQFSNCSSYDGKPGDDLSALFVKIRA